MEQNEVVYFKEIRIASPYVHTISMEVWQMFCSAPWQTSEHPESGQLGFQIVLHNMKECWIPRVPETHRGSCTELQSYQTYPYKDSRVRSHGHPTRSSGNHSATYTQPVKSSPRASYQKGA